MSTTRRWLCVAAVVLVSAYAWLQGFGTSFVHALLGLFVRDRSPWVDTWVGVVFHASMVQLTLAGLVAMRLGPAGRAFRTAALALAALPALFLAAGLVMRFESDAALTALLMALLAYRFGVLRPTRSTRPLFVAWAACAAIPVAAAVESSAFVPDVIVPAALAFGIILWLGATVLRPHGDPAAEIAPAA